MVNSLFRVQYDGSRLKEWVTGSTVNKLPFVQPAQRGPTRQTTTTTTTEAGDGSRRTARRNDDDDDGGDDDDETDGDDDDDDARARGWDGATRASV